MVKFRFNDFSPFSWMSGASLKPTIAFYAGWALMFVFVVLYVRARTTQASSSVSTSGPIIFRAWPTFNFANLQIQSVSVIIPAGFDTLDIMLKSCSNVDTDYASTSISASLDDMLSVYQPITDIHLRKLDKQDWRIAETGNSIFNRNDNSVSEFVTWTAASLFLTQDLSFFDANAPTTDSSVRVGFLTLTDRPTSFTIFSQVAP